MFFIPMSNLFIYVFMMIVNTNVISQMEISHLGLHGL